MTPRKRSKKNKTLESVPNLYARKKGSTVYYEYRRPDTGKTHGIGTDRQKAIVAARQLNARLMPGQDLIATVLETANITLADIIDDFTIDKVKNNPTLADSTRREKTLRLKRIARDIGSASIASFRTLEIAQYLETYSGDAYRQYRSVLRQLFDYAITKGHRSTNPVEPTEKRDLSHSKSRKRLTTEQFKAIREIADPWFQVAMDLALLLCQGRSEVVGFRFSDIKSGVLYFTRTKTQQYDSASVAATVSPELEEVITRAKSLPPLSPFVVHKHLRTGRKGAVKPEMLSREFQKLRDRVPSIASMPAAERPTFHEIRALGASLLEHAGWSTEQIQQLMAHADVEMTEVYLAGHGEKWVKASAGNIKLW